MCNHVRFSAQFKFGMQSTANNFWRKIDWMPMKYRVYVMCCGMREKGCSPYWSHEFILLDICICEIRNSWNNNRKYVRGNCVDIWLTFLPWQLSINQNINEFLVKCFVQIFWISKYEMVYVGLMCFFLLEFVEMKCNKYAKCENCIGCKSKLRSISYIGSYERIQKMKKKMTWIFVIPTTKWHTLPSFQNDHALNALEKKTPFAWPHPYIVSYYSKMRWVCR